MNTTKPNTPLRTAEHTLAVSAADYPILKRQVAKLRADFITWMYERSALHPGCVFNGAQGEDITCPRCLKSLTERYLATHP